MGYKPAMEEVKKKVVKKEGKKEVKKDAKSKEVKKTSAKKETKKEIKKEVRKESKKEAKKTGAAIDDKKVKGNPSGKYNMKFIDWTNEWEQVYTYMHDPEAKENPCGLDEEVFEAIVVCGV
eukprot:TRINITY_DN10455_c0_g1_i5.p3 TRINITY_DN10455_c0_g1~~TRINITY_DN10455_c0_g1_i5.p3  ORF type:complete len:121 (+),score=66.34 TRINITY_DN10455_c0_g1_i5:128-490(+)